MNFNKLSCPYIMVIMMFENVARVLFFAEIVVNSELLDKSIRSNKIMEEMWINKKPNRITKMNNHTYIYRACKGSAKQCNGSRFARKLQKFEGEWERRFMMTVTAIMNKVWITNLGHVVQFLLDSSAFSLVGLLFAKKFKLDMVFELAKSWWIGHFADANTCDRRSYGTNTFEQPNDVTNTLATNKCVWISLVLIYRKLLVQNIPL